MKGTKKTERKALKSSRPAKKHKPISQYYSKQPAEEEQEDCRGGSRSPHSDQPTPATGAAWAQLPRAGGDHKVSTTMLKSLQRRFLQQTLKSPFTEAAADGGFNAAAQAADNFGGDFVLHSSQTYERELSQPRGGCDVDAAGPSYTQEAPTQTQFDVPSQRRAWQELHSRLSQPSAGQPSCSTAGGQEEGEHATRRASNASTCSYRTTPGGCMEDEPPGSALAGTKLFPIFRSRKDLKVLHVIRHGESEYNAASNGSLWEDPEIYDAPLTERGKRQAMALGQQLASMNLPYDTLFVTSPLTRAIQTLLLLVRALPAAARGPLNIAVRSEITEKLTTRGDVGRPASVLMEQFPQLKGQLQGLPEVWWHSDPSNPNCAMKKQLASKEKKKQLQRRISDFKRWMLSRPERVIVAVGHSLTWRELMQGQMGAGEVGYMKNCELHTLHL